MVSAPVSVLTNRCLLRVIARFQHGVPQVAHEQWRARLAEAEKTRFVGIQDEMVILLEVVVRVCDLCVVDSLCTFLLFGRRLEKRHIQTSIAGIGRIETLEWFSARFGFDAACWSRSFREAIHRGMYAAARWLLDKYPEEFVTPTNETLCALVEWGNLDLLRTIVTTHERDERLYDGLLRTAAYYGHLHVVDYLHTNKLTNDECDVICSAVEGGALHVVEYLLLRGICSQDDIKRALESAAGEGNFEMVRLLARHCARPAHG